MPKTDTNEEKIDEILERGTIVQILPNKEEFRQKLLSGEKLRFYIGFDPTAPTLHLSHAKNILLLEKFRKLGHEVILLFGDFTARIGDPSDEASTRKQFSGEEVSSNVKKWMSLVGPLMDFDDKNNPPQVKFNNDWLSKLSFEQLITLASNFTVQQMLERDMFEKRINAGQPVHLHEFLYPLMQGYDSVAMDVDVELCGTDQIFNALAGRTLMKKLKGKEKFVVAVTLMENPKTGELMSKSKGTGVFLDATPEDMYGQIMSQPDEMIKILFVNLTEFSLEKIDEIVGLHPKEAKRKLAKEIVSMYHGEEVAEPSAENFEKTFSKGEMPTDAKEVKVKKGTALQDTLTSAGLVKSNTTFRRLVSEGAIKLINKGDKVVSDPKFLVEEDLDIRVGKKRFIKIRVS
jgi:tyrosyl-tRNA synthetase